MADITTLYQGEVSEEGKQNWRGDQVSVPQGDQSIYKTSSVALVELGSRKVVGDRVFRYAQAGGAIGAGDIAQYGANQLVNVTGGGTDPAGGKAFTFYFATSAPAGQFNEGILIAQSGTAANLGHVYRVKEQPIVATTSNAQLILYDPLVKAENATDKFTLCENLYKGVTECTAGTAPAMGVAPILVTSGDYFWLQTWGPVAIKNSAVAAAGRAIAPGATGQAQDLVVGTTASPKQFIGMSMQVMTASQYGVAFLQIAP